MVCKQFLVGNCFPQKNYKWSSKIKGQSGAAFLMWGLNPLFNLPLLPYTTIHQSDTLMWKSTLLNTKPRKQWLHQNCSVSVKWADVLRVTCNLKVAEEVDGSIGREETLRTPLHFSSSLSGTSFYIKHHICKTKCKTYSS